MRDKSSEIQKYLLGLLFVVFTFCATMFLTSDTAYAGCSHATCICQSKGISNCSGICWYGPIVKARMNSYIDGHCEGHNFSGIAITSGNPVIQSPATCTSTGIIVQATAMAFVCMNSSCQLNSGSPLVSDVWLEEVGRVPAVGHLWSDWYDGGSNDVHYKTCQRSVHNEAYDGAKTLTQNHILGGEHQHGDWKWHKDCTIYNCFRNDVQWGWNTGTIRFHDSVSGDPSSQSGDTDGSQGATAPGQVTTGGRTRVGWNEHSTSTQVYNSPGKSSWNWNCGSVRTYNSYVSEAQNNRYGYDDAAAVYEYNYVQLVYHSGYSINGTTYTDTVDYANFVTGGANYAAMTGGATGANKTLITRPITQYTRDGYDIISNGWYSSAAGALTSLDADTLAKVLEMKCSKNPSDKYSDAYHQLDYSNWTIAFKFKTGYTPSQYAPNIVNSHVVTVNLYARWRAHKLTVHYDLNGGELKSSSGASIKIPDQVMYYNDGSQPAQTPKTTYALTDSAPTKSGYTFMGWGNNTSWVHERYANRVSDAFGTKVAFDSTQAKAVEKTAQDWCAWAGNNEGNEYNKGKDLKKGDMEITLYAQWERLITYSFNYYNGKTNISVVAFHNDDDQFLYMDTQMNYSGDKHAVDGKYTKIDTFITFNGENDWASRGFKRDIQDNTAEIEIAGQTDKLPVTAGDTYYFYTHAGFTSEKIPVTSASNNIKYEAGSWSFRSDSLTTPPESFIYTDACDTRYVRIYPDYPQTATYYLSYQRIVTVDYHDYEDNTKHNGGDYNKSHIDRQNAYLNWVAIATKPEFKTHIECDMNYSEAAANGRAQKENWTAFGWVSSNSNDVQDEKAYTETEYLKLKNRTPGNKPTEPKAIDQNVSFVTNRDLCFYGMYYKDVTTKYDLNGGNVVVDPTRFSNTRVVVEPKTTVSNNKFTYRRYANTGTGKVTKTVNSKKTYEPTNTNIFNKYFEYGDPSTTSQQFVLELPEYRNGQFYVYDFMLWTYDKLPHSSAQIYSHRIIGSQYVNWEGLGHDGANIDSLHVNPNGIINDRSGNLLYTPVVSNTIYAAWTNVQVPGTYPGDDPENKDCNCGGNPNDPDCPCSDPNDPGNPDGDDKCDCAPKEPNKGECNCGGNENDPNCPCDDPKNPNNPDGDDKCDCGNKGGCNCGGNENDPDCPCDDPDDPRNPDGDNNCDCGNKGGCNCGGNEDDPDCPCDDPDDPRNPDGDDKCDCGDPDDGCNCGGSNPDDPDDPNCPCGPNCKCKKHPECGCGGNEDDPDCPCDDPNKPGNPDGDDKCDCGNKGGCNCGGDPDDPDCPCDKPDDNDCDCGGDPENNCPCPDNNKDGKCHCRKQKHCHCKGNPDDPNCPCQDPENPNNPDGDDNCDCGPNDDTGCDCGKGPGCNCGGDPDDGGCNCGGDPDDPDCPCDKPDDNDCDCGGDPEDPDCPCEDNNPDHKCHCRKQKHCHCKGNPDDPNCPCQDPENPNNPDGDDKCDCGPNDDTGCDCGPKDPGCNCGGDPDEPDCPCDKPDDNDCDCGGDPENDCPCPDNNKDGKCHCRKHKHCHCKGNPDDPNCPCQDPENPNNPDGDDKCDCGPNDDTGCDCGPKDPGCNCGGDPDKPDCPCDKPDDNDCDCGGDPEDPDCPCEDNNPDHKCHCRKQKHCHCKGNPDDPNCPCQDPENPNNPDGDDKCDCGPNDDTGCDCGPKDPGCNCGGDPDEPDCPCDKPDDNDCDCGGDPEDPDCPCEDNNPDHKCHCRKHKHCHCKGNPNDPDCPCQDPENPNNPDGDDNCDCGPNDDTGCNCGPKDPGCNCGGNEDDPDCPCDNPDDPRNPDGDDKCDCGGKGGCNCGGNENDPDCPCDDPNNPNNPDGDDKCDCGNKGGCNCGGDPDDPDCPCSDPNDPRNPDGDDDCDCGDDDSKDPNPPGVIPDPSLELRLPYVNIKKEAWWYNPNGDNIAVDYDDLQNIDINGLVKVKVTVNITKATKDGVQIAWPTGMLITDYFDIGNWKYYKTLETSGCILNASQTRNGIMTLTVNEQSDTSYEATYTYLLQLHEEHWDVPNNERKYSNKITYERSYLESLLNRNAEPNYWVVDKSNTHNSFDEAAHIQYVYLAYSIKAEETDDNLNIFTGRKLNVSAFNATPYVMLREVNWRATDQDIENLTIRTSTNVYRDITSGLYKRTYFVQYDTKSPTKNSANSTFNIYSNASIRRSYDYYNITDNLLDIYQFDSNRNQVIDNNIGLTSFTSKTIKDSTSSDRDPKFNAGELLRTSTADNYHKSVFARHNKNYYTVEVLKANGLEEPEWVEVKRRVEEKYSTLNGEDIEYPYGGLTSVSTLYATNQDNVKFSIYPYVRTTNGKTKKVFETTRYTDTTNVPDRATIDDKRLDITIDATDPIIYPDERILTERTVDGVTQEWVNHYEDIYGNEYDVPEKDGLQFDGYTTYSVDTTGRSRSDGYADINLVNNLTGSGVPVNPLTETKVLTFTFEDKVSGVNAPTATTEDWIERPRDNVQVRLERVDNEEIVIFDSTDDSRKDWWNNNTDVVKVTYDNAFSMNKTGKITITLDPSNNDIMGHLKLTIRVYDNVSNWTEKIYDLYVFCLTGEIRQSSTLPRYDADGILNHFRNGEMGIVNIDAGGYADRVTTTFPENLVKLYEKEARIRKAFLGERSLNGDYPDTDYRSFSAEISGTTKAYGEDKYILPYNWQVNRWGYTIGRLGGIRLSLVDIGADYFNQSSTITVNNSILNDHLPELINNFVNNSNSTITKDDTACVTGLTLYTYPTYSGTTVNSYAHIYEVDPSRVVELGGKIYPASVILDGNVEIEIRYTKTDFGYEATVEPTTEVETIDGAYASSWNAVEDNDGQTYAKRPLAHYFFVPLETPLRNSSDPYKVRLTSYKDSEKAFAHYVSVDLTWTNEASDFKDFQTIIRDN